MKRQNRTHRYSVNQIDGYVIDSLNSGLVSGYLVPAFSFDGEFINVTSYYEGYITADRISFADVIQILNLLLKAAENVNDGENHLVPDRYFSYEPSSVFYSPMTGDVKLEFTVSDESRGYADLLNGLCKGYKGRDVKYAFDISEYISRNNPGFKMLKKEIIDTKRRVISDRIQKP